MKSLDGGSKENKASKSNSTENCDQIATVEEKIDFSNVKIEPLFEETVDFDTFSKSDFRAVKVKECVAVPKRDVYKRQCKNCPIRKWFKSSKDGNVEQDCKGTWHSAGRIIL